jgi:hypothetical protein
MIAAHAENAVGDDDGALARLGGLSEAALEVVDVEVTVDVLLAGPRQGDRVDDAVMVEFVADDGGLVGYKRRQPS